MRLNEGMHSTIGPWEESKQIYIQQSTLSERFSRKDEKGPVVVYDVGLGIGANALAAVECFVEASHSLSLSVARDLHLVSFENDPGGIELALNHRDRFPFLSRHESLVRSLLRERSIAIQTVSGRKFQWDLYLGDCRDLIPRAPVPEIIYYDLFSPKVCPELWGIASFTQLFRATETRRAKGLSTQLLTYTSATSVRAALLLSGFHVGYGVSTAAKKETTFASTQFKDLTRPFGEAWIEHWRRSEKPLPPDIDLFLESYHSKHSRMFS